MSTETAHLIAPVTRANGDVQFQLPVDASLIASFEAVDLDLMLVSTTGEKYILQQGALQAAINPESKLLFSNGESLSAADQIKRLGILKPVEGGSFRLASASLPDTPEKISGIEFGLGKDTQDTAAKIEKILQALEAATQSNTADTPHSTTANGGTKVSSREAVADPLASPSPGAPPAPEEIKNTNTSDVKVNSTARAFTGNSGDAVSGVLVTAVGTNSFNPSKSLSQVDFTQIDVSKTIKVDLNSQRTFDVEVEGKASATITLPGVLNAKSLVLTATATLPDGFTIDGQSFVDGKLTITNVSSLTDLKLPVSWKVGATPINDFSVAVKFYDGATALDYGNAPLNFYHANSLPTETLDSNSNAKLFLSTAGYSYDITGTSGNNDIKGGSGNDKLDGGSGNDTMSGGAGNDTYIVDSTADTVIEATNAGTDTVVSSVNYTLGDNLENLTLTGTATLGTGNNLENILIANNAGDTLYGLAGNDTLTGGTGNDTLDGGTENDTMSGGAGNDTYIVDSATDSVTEAASAGTDTVQSSVNFTLGANLENLTLTGSAAINGTGNDLNNTITGNSASNTLDGGLGFDTLIGGDGNDTYIVDSTTDIITETNTGGTDIVKSSVSLSLVDTDGTGANGGNIENLTLTGAAAINATGNALANTLTGNDGDNTLIGAAGADQLIGGAGSDTASYSGSVSGVTVSLVTSSGIGGDAQGDTLYGIENLTGSAYNDTLTGDSSANILDGGTGNDTMSGGAGNDTYIVDSTTDIITETTTGGTDTIQSSVSFSLVDTDGTGANGGNIENLTLTGTAAINGTGNSAANTITGNSYNNTLIGGAGSDTLIGGAGNDTASYSGSTDGVTVSLVTGATNIGGDAQGDTLSGIENITGSAFNDTLTGDANDNTLIGGDGADSLNGGAGNDTLDLKTNTTATAFALDSADGGTGNDTVIVSQSGLGGALNGGAHSDTLVVYGGTNATLNISSLNAHNFEKIDVKTDSNATNVVLSSTAISNFVNATGSDTLTLRIGSEDSYSIATESGVTFTQGQSIKFFSTSNALIAQVNFEYV